MLETAMVVVSDSDGDINVLYLMLSQPIFGLKGIRQCNLPQCFSLFVTTGDLRCLFLLVYSLSTSVDGIFGVTKIIPTISLKVIETGNLKHVSVFYVAAVSCLYFFIFIVYSLYITRLDHPRLLNSIEPVGIS